MEPYLPAPDESLLIGVLRLSLHIPGARSLKDRRKVVQALRDRAHARHKAAFAEVGHLEAHDAAVLAVALVGNDAKNLRARLDAVRSDAWSSPEAHVLSAIIDIRPFAPPTGFRDIEGA